METQTFIWIGIILLIVYLYFNTKKEKLSQTCDIKACNSKMRQFIENSWSFNNSSKQFKECNKCDSLWFRSSDFKTSTDGEVWEKHDNLREVYNDIKINN
jgi:hypothetical protein